MSVQVTPNANFHTVTAKSVFDDRRDPAFLEYRRRWHEDPAGFVAGAFPIHLDIESTSVCNLLCPFCSTTSKTWGPGNPGYMKMELFRRIIDEGAEHGLCSIKLSFRGEPLLHQQLPEMVAYAKSRNILDVYFNTNATLLTKTRIDQLIDAGLDRISISFEGVTKDAYEAYRVGAKFEKVVANARLLRRIRDERGSRLPQIRIQSVGLPELQSSFDDYVRMWSDVADEIGYLDAREEGPEYDHRGRPGDWACPFLWQRMTILWDGTLLPCLMHGVSDFSLLAHGNVTETSIKESWQGAREQHFRELHRNGRAGELEACDRCSYRAKELDKLRVPYPPDVAAARRPGVAPLTFRSSV
jgi:radical SAM protein with 4Fe4S-binding SPASM domain